jgi:hypothetical protein
MTITIPTDQVFAALGYGENWGKGTYRACGAMCLHGAIRACQPVPGDAYLIEAVANQQGWGTSFNDDHGTKWSDVEAAIRTHREVTDADLAETFGPTWQIVVDTVRTAASATPDQIERLAAAWAAAWDAIRAATRNAAWAAAWDAARDAAWDATRAATRNAAWAAAWDATRDATRDAAWDATRAAAWAATRTAVVVDLVGQHGLTADHVRALTGPWCEVFPQSLLARTVAGLD